ncbi:MAG: chemotaxis protein CheB [Chitinophagaceae bacterium]|nr:MAG: chemotaxis protein CheB [Chitinophagaceae bacterium]
MEEIQMRAGPTFIVIGGSAGSLQVILRILTLLDHEFKTPILIVLHRHVNADSPLEELLSFRTTLISREVEEKDRITDGYIYICPADYHTLVEKDFSFSLDDSEKINFSRPSIDVVFRSAADIYREKLLCVLLSGANADGAAGMKYAQELGGVTVVQDPADAQVPYMPQQALKMLNPDYVLESSRIAALLNSKVVV